MKKTSLLAIGWLFAISGSYGQEFDSLRAPKVWFAADRSTLTPNMWTDVGIFANHGIAPNATSAPQQYQSINFNKALVFDGVDDHFKITYSLEHAPEISILAVFQSSDTTERGIWATENSTARKILLTTRRAIGPDTITDRYGKFEKTVALSSIVQNWENIPPPTTPASTIVVGHAGQDKPYQRFRGALAELIIFNHALSFLDRVQYETYLAIKYGTGLKAGNFVSSGQQVLWRVSENAAYGRNIAGIGRDDHFHLYQKQSGSAYDSGLLVMSAGVLAVTNQANSSIIDDRNFLLWGDNSAPLNTRRGTGEDTLLAVLQRKWLVTSTGNMKGRLATNLYVDVAKLPAEPMSYWLVIDRTGQGNFSVDNLEYISPARKENGKLVYENVQWDTDGSGKDNFSFARKQNLLVIVRKRKDPLCSDETGGEVGIEVVAGDPSFSFSLTNEQQTVTRNWRDREFSSKQSDLTADRYILTVDDNDDESITRKFELHVSDRLIVDLGPDQVYDPATPIQLNAASQIPADENVTYHWESSFGSTADSENIAVTEPGVYRATVTRKSDGCEFSDQIAITGSDEERISVYPTLIRSSEPYNIGISLPKESGVTVNIINGRGMIVQTLAGKNNSEYLLTTSVKDPGVYMIIIQTSTGIETRKIIAY